MVRGDHRNSMYSTHKHERSFEGRIAFGSIVSIMRTRRRESMTSAATGPDLGVELAGYVATVEIGPARR